MDENENTSNNRQMQVGAWYGVLPCFYVYNM